MSEEEPVCEHCREYYADFEDTDLGWICKPCHDKVVADRVARNAELVVCKMCGDLITDKYVVMVANIGTESEQTIKSPLASVLENERFEKLDEDWDWLHDACDKRRQIRTQIGEQVAVGEKGLEVMKGWLERMSGVVERGVGSEEMLEHAKMWVEELKKVEVLMEGA